MDALLSLCTNMTIYLECWQVLKSVLAGLQTSIGRFSGISRFSGSSMEGQGFTILPKKTKFISPVKSVSLVLLSRLLIIEILSALLFSEMFKFFGVGDFCYKTSTPDHQGGKFVQLELFMVGDF
jgi:hypothetical protein